ncbi:MAG: AAA family ATPase [Candidatus Geothermarchaeota archaeon]
MSIYSDPEYIKRLEREALNYATLATEADKKGLKPLAINYYSRAIDVLSKLLDCEESPTLRQTYMKKLREYKYRLTYLKGMLAGKLEGDARVLDNLQTQPAEPKTVEWEEEWRPFKSSITWNDVVNLEEVKKVIKQIIVYPTKRPDLFPLGWPRGLLLYGPPGCGKTTIAAAVSNEIGAEFYPIDASMILSKWLGESEKKVASLFKYLRHKAYQNIPVILFIDEADSLFGVRSNETGGEVRARNQFLREIDGLEEKGNYKLPFYIIASTNKPWQLDFAFIRRFNKRIYVPPPNFEMRKKLFSYFLSKLSVEPDINYDELAKLTKDYSASDIKDVCQTAHLEVISEFFESGKALNPSSKPRPITMDDLLEAVKKVRPSISPELQHMYEVWTSKFVSM